MKYSIIFFIIAFIYSVEATASCRLPELIPEHEKINITSKLKFDVIDTNFLGNQNLNVVRMFIPSTYNKIQINTAHMTIWKNKSVVSHSSLGINRLSYDESVKYIEFTLNKHDSNTPKITIVYGDMCYNMHQINIDDLSLYELSHDKDSQIHWESSHQKFLTGRK